MAGSYTQLNIQFVFAVKFRETLIREDFREQLEKYITGIVQNRRHKLHAIYCMPDHAHVFVGKLPYQSESDLVRDIKSNSSKFINEQDWVEGTFSWQKGYGAFSYSRWDVDKIINYIRNQRAHHAKQSFKREYLDTLKKFEVEYEDEYLFDWFD